MGFARLGIKPARVGIEERLLAQRGELAKSSYEVLRRQHEQVMMLRHDTMKHFQVLRQTISDEKAAAYLDELIGENEKIRPVYRAEMKCWM